MKPVISVIMPVYNAALYLKEAIQSILSQSFPDFELIIINDGSSDTSEKVIKDFNDSRIVYIKNQDNIGQTKSLNKGILIAQGEFVARMDADDISLPKRFYRQIEFLRQNERVAVVGTWHQEIDTKGRFIRKCFYPILPSVRVRINFSRLVGWASIGHPSTMIRKRVLDELGAYNPEFYICQDYDLWLRIARKYVLENIPEILLKYRVHEHSLTNKFSGQTLKEHNQVLFNNMNFYMQKYNSQNINQLFAILSNNPQEKNADIEGLNSLFDAFYLKAFSQELQGDSSDYYLDLKERLKIFYLPQLSKTHRRKSVSLFLKALLRYPSTVLSRRFIGVARNILK